ncbi:hypothetical protein QYF36_008363 [Acer negundo]|nr:hypothetical protein QYF36_008363 [Acer negundo]
MVATLGHLCKEVLVLAMISLSLALSEDDNFSEANNPHLNGTGYIISNSLLILNKQFRIPRAELSSSSSCHVLGSL